MLFLRRYTLKRTFVHAEDQKVSGRGDLEKGSGGDAAELEENEVAIGASPMPIGDEKTTGESATSPTESKDSTQADSCVDGGDH